MKLNWKKFAGLFVLLNLVLFLGGCTASWIGAIQGLMPAIQAAITALFSFIGALEGKTIPASVTAFVQKLEQDVSTELTNVSSILATITANASQSVLSQIEAVFNTIITNLNSILSGLNVTDSSTIAKITDLVGLAVAAVEAVLTLIPLAMKASTLSEEEQVHADKAATNSIKNTHKVLQQTYHTVVTTPTENVDVNTALAALPQTLP
jgi:hypothetical protein